MAAAPDPKALLNEIGERFSRFRKTAGIDGQDGAAGEMRRNRAVNARLARTASAASGVRSGASIDFATGRPRDPMFYWKQNNLPYDLYDHEELKKVRTYMRLLYQSHPLIGSCVDIYTKYPLLGLEFQCKDEKLTDFHSDLFLSEEGLNYSEFLIDFGREYWTVGEAVPFGSFNEVLGIWDDEELLNPDDVEVVQSPFLKEPRYFIKLPERLREIITKRTPVWEYEQLMAAYPELAHYTAEDALMPVSSILLRHYKFKADTFNKRGVPLTMRSMRAVMQEEMLNAARDAVADRLYTPLILARLGASATDLGTTQPWIPTPEDLADFEESLDAALAADFRVLIHHFGVQMESVFGKENLPDFIPDFEQLEDRMLQTFGLSKTMLTGASCLTGDTVIHLSRAGKGFTMPLADVVARFNHDDAHLPARRWREDIETYVARADGDVVRLGLLVAAYESGVKQVFQVTTAQGRSIKASAQHPFLTEGGQWVELADLVVGDRVRVNTGHSTRGAAWPQGYKQAWTRYHPFQAKRGMRHGKPRYSTGEHRAAMEAAISGVSLEDFLYAVRYDEVRAKEFTYIDPKIFHVHHRDENKRNNDLANLALLSVSEHKQHHADETTVLWQVGVDEIVSILPLGEEMTYDLTMASEPHNFLADDFVVHNSGQTYAADALNRDLVSQLLTTYQKMCARHYRQRALVVAEAQEHYDYDERNGKRYVKMEEILEIDEGGNETIIEQPKLLIPDMTFKTMNIKDEEAQREFIEAMRASGVPISMKRRLVHVGIDLTEEIEVSKDEQVQLAIAEQETRKEIYKGLKDAGLPVPQDLKTDFEPRAANAMPVVDSMGLRVPMMGIDPVTGLPTLAPTAGDFAAPTAGGVVMPGQPAQPVDPFTPAGDAGGGANDQDQRPEESDEMREDMPKAAVYKGNLEPAPLHRRATRMREIVKDHHEPLPAIDEHTPMRRIAKKAEKDLAEGEEMKYDEVPDDGVARGGYADPKHVGMRRYAFDDPKYRDRKGNLLPIDRDTFDAERPDPPVRAVS